MCIYCFHFLFQYHEYFFNSDKKKKIDILEKKKKNAHEYIKEIDNMLVCKNVSPKEEIFLLICILFKMKYKQKPFIPFAFMIDFIDQTNISRRRFAESRQAFKFRID